MSKYTPGPWQEYADLPSTDPSWHIVTNETRMRVLANIHIEPGNKMDEANARLIVAAPDLLEALQALMDEQNGPPLIRDAPRWEAAVDLARAAIAKAEGDD
jgi:hypothetical protein